MIGRSGERGSGISVRAVRHDDDDIYMYTRRQWNLIICMVVSTESDCCKLNLMELLVIDWYTWLNQPVEGYTLQN